MSGDEAYAVFFAGACQVQYLAHLYGAVSPAERFIVGKRLTVDVALDGAPAPCLDQAGFLAQAERAAREGKRAILVVHQTSRDEYVDLLKPYESVFAERLLLPHLHFKSLWPEHILNKPLEDITDHTLLRNFAFEKHGFARMLSRCGVEDPGFLDAYWEQNRRDLLFYRAAHPSGEVLAQVLDLMRPALGDRLPHYDALTQAVRASDGVFQNTAHPIRRRVGEVLDIAWSRTEFYQAWIELSEAARDRPRLRAATRRAQSALEDPAVSGVVTAPHRSHLRAALGYACLRLRRREQGLALLQQASVELKGFAPLLGQTLKYALKYGRADVVERTLVDVAPVLDLSENLHVEGFRAILQSILQDPAARDAAQRAQDQIGGSTWLHGELRELASAA